MYKNLIDDAKRAGIEKYYVEVILHNEGKILLLERHYGKMRGGIYELPTAKIKEGEEISQALKRIVMQETGLEIERIDAYLSHQDFEKKGGEIARAFVFIAAPKEPYAIELKDHIGFAWVSSAEASSYPIDDHIRSLFNIFENWKKQA